MRSLPLNEEMLRLKRKALEREEKLGDTVSVGGVALLLLVALSGSSTLLYSEYTSRALALLSGVEPTPLQTLRFGPADVQGLSFLLAVLGRVRYSSGYPLYRNTDEYCIPPNSGRFSTLCFYF